MWSTKYDGTTLKAIATIQTIKIIILVRFIVDTYCAFIGWQITKCLEENTESYLLENTKIERKFIPQTIPHTDPNTIPQTIPQMNLWNIPWTIPQTIPQTIPWTIP